MRRRLHEETNCPVFDFKMFLGILGLVSEFCDFGFLGGRLFCGQVSNGVSVAENRLVCFFLFDFNLGISGWRQFLSCRVGGVGGIFFVWRYF